MRERYRDLARPRWYVEIACVGASATTAGHPELDLFGSKIVISGWNNTGDYAYLRTPSGALMDSCTWGSTGSSRPDQQIW